MSKPAVSRFPKILVFDTTDRERTTVALVVNGKAKKLSAPVRAQDLQKLTAELLESIKTEIKDIDAVAVLTGPGSFTGTRMGVAAANTFGWLMNKPIIALDSLPGMESGSDSFDRVLKQLKESPPEVVSQAKVRY